MQVCIEKKYIEDIVRALGRISLKGVVHPVLKLSRVNISKKEVVISATNLSLAVVISIPISSDEEKEFFIDTNSFERALSGMLSSPDVTLDLKENFVEIKTKTSRAKLPYQDGEDMPSIPQVSGNSVSFPASNLKRALQVTIPAASTTDIKPELASLFITLKDNSLTSVATDAFQLIEYIEGINISDEVSFLLPAREAADILKIIEPIEGSISGSYSDTLFEIDTKTIKVITKLTQGLFPDYTSIIPKEEISQAHFLRSDLDMALKFLMQLRSENNHIKISVEEEKITLYTKSSAGGDSEYTLPSSLKGEPFKGTILAGHLKTLGSSTPGDGIYLSYYGENKPFVATAAQGNSFRYLMMPISS